MPFLYLNGKFIDHTEAALDPLDRGVLLGDGIFETIRCEEGQLLLHGGHFARLARNARLTQMTLPHTAQELLDIGQQVLDANGLTLARLRITVTRGELGASPEIGSAKTAPTVLVSAAPIDQAAIDAKRAAGWNGATVPFPLNHRSPLAQVKTTSYQERLLARHAVRAKGADEGIFRNTEGHIAEGVMSNIFAVIDGRVCTPPVDDGALPGIIRLKIGLLCARLGLEYSEDSLTPRQLRNATELFCTNAVMEVMPLVTLDEIPVGDGTPGPIAARLLAEHRRDIEQFLQTMRTG